MATSPTTGVPQIPHHIRRTMVGKVKLRVSKAETIGSADPLRCYEGSVRFGDTDPVVNATILAFDACHAEHVCSKLGSINSPFVMNVLASLSGTQGKSGIRFVAFPRFQKTYACYIEKNSKKTFEKGRFTEEFATVTKNVIQGLDILHENGFCCPNLKGQHIAVMYDSDHPLAKIWNFCLAETDKDKFSDWIVLADKLEEAAANHNVVSLEINDLCEQLRKGVLVGRKALKHCSLASVREKFDKILALNLHVFTFCKGQQSRQPFNDPEKMAAHSALEVFLTDNCYWTVDTPQWIIDVNDSRNLPAPPVENGETFIWGLRCIVEHEGLYIPPTIGCNKDDPTIGCNKDDPTIGCNKDDPDLESEVRGAWQELFLKVLNFATKMDLKY